MSILEGLASKKGERSENANQKVAVDCIQNPALLDEIAAGLVSVDSRLAGDCAEVFTMTAMSRPDLIAPYVETLCAVRRHKATRVRWEAAHCLALVAALRSDLLTPLISEVMETIRKDESIIVRDYSIDILANLSSAGENNASQAFVGLIESLALWNGRHAGHALAGLAHAARFLPEKKQEILSAIEPCLSSEKGVIRKAAEKAAKACK